VHRIALPLAVLFFGCGPQSGTLGVNTAPEDDAFGTSDIDDEIYGDDLIEELPWEHRECTRAFAYEYVPDDDRGDKGIIRGQWDGGIHGIGTLDGYYEWDHDYGWVEGTWTDGNREGEFSGWMNEHQGEEYLQGWFWSDDDGYGYFSSGNKKGETLGSGWWSFAEAWVNGRAQVNDDGSGSFEGGFSLGDDHGTSSGEWGYFGSSNHQGGWFAMAVDTPSFTENVEGDWYPYDRDDMFGWNGSLGDWGYMMGESGRDQQGRWISGSGFPYGCE
jgi:hypothetical protein